MKTTKEVAARDVHPEAAVEHKSARMLHDIISNVKQRIAAMGWKVESRSHGRSPRTRYISPDGNVFYTIHKIMNHLKEQEDVLRVPRSQENIRSPQVKIELITNKQSINNKNDTEPMEMLDSEALDASTSPPVQENFNSVDPASARYRHRGSLNLPPKDLQWGSRKLRYTRSKMRIKKPYVVMDSGTSRQKSNPVFDYYNLFHEKTGRRKDNVAEKVMDHMKDKALSFLINLGWNMRTEGKVKVDKLTGEKKKTRKLKLYYSPKGKRFVSLWTACEHWIEEQRRSGIGHSTKKVRDAKRANVQTERLNMTSYVEEDESSEDNSNEDDDSDYEI